MQRLIRVGRIMHEVREIIGTGVDRPTGFSDCDNDTPTTLQQPKHHDNTLLNYNEIRYS